MGVPLDQFKATHPRGSGSANDTLPTTHSTVSSGGSLFCPAKWVNQKNTSVANNISAITMPLIKNFPNATAESLMAHGNLRYDNICAGNKGTCLNYNLF
jgi:hypothetical protein